MAWMKKLVGRFAPLVEDPLPVALRERHHLEPLGVALRAGG
jgi:hypothetical protein